MKHNLMIRLSVALFGAFIFSQHAHANEANAGEKIAPPVIELPSSPVAVEYSDVGYQDNNGGTGYREYITSTEAYQLADGSIRLVEPYRHTAVGNANFIWSQRKDLCGFFKYSGTISTEKGIVVTQIHRTHRNYETMSAKTKKHSIVEEAICKP